MNTLLLRLVGPMQAWGVQSQYKERDTELEPSKSGVIGLLCAALGRERHAPIDDLATLTMGVRVDREGVRLKDFHTAGKGGFFRARGGKETTNVTLSTRWYLADAAFLVGLASDNLTLLETLHLFLRQPHWPLSLGRKAFVPSTSIYLKEGLRRGQTLEDALKNFPWLGRETERRKTPQLRVVLDDSDGPIVRPDHPLSFALFDRRFAPRRVKQDFWPVPTTHLEDC